MKIETEEVKGNDQVINCAHHDSALRLEMRGLEKRNQVFARSNDAVTTRFPRRQ
jgi:hypothetical protein